MTHEISAASQQITLSNGKPCSITKVPNSFNEPDKFLELQFESEDFRILVIFDGLGDKYELTNNDTVKIID